MSEVCNCPNCRGVGWEEEVPSVEEDGHDDINGSENADCASLVVY